MLTCMKKIMLDIICRTGNMGYHMTASGCQSSHGSVALLLTTSGFQPLSNLAWMAGQLVHISHIRNIATTNIREPTGQSVPYFSCRLLRFLESTNYKHSRPPLVRRTPSPAWGNTLGECRLQKCIPPAHSPLTWRTLRGHFGGT